MGRQADNAAREWKRRLQMKPLLLGAEEMDEVRAGLASGAQELAQSLPKVTRAGDSFDVPSTPLKDPFLCDDANENFCDVLIALGLLSQCRNMLDRKCGEGLRLRPSVPDHFWFFLTWKWVQGLQGGMLGSLIDFIMREESSHIIDAAIKPGAL